MGGNFIWWLLWIIVYVTPPQIRDEAFCQSLGSQMMDLTYWDTCSLWMVSKGPWYNMVSMKSESCLEKAVTTITKSGMWWGWKIFYILQITYHVDTLMFEFLPVELWELDVSLVLCSPGLVLVLASIGNFLLVCKASVQVQDQGRKEKSTHAVHLMNRSCTVRWLEDVEPDGRK